MSLPPFTPPTDLPGPIAAYLSRLPDADRLRCADAIRAALSTADGKLLLEIMEMATHDRMLPLTDDARALGAVMAQRFIPHDLRRIVDADPDDPILAPPGPKPAPRSRG